MRTQKTAPQEPVKMTLIKHTLPLTLLTAFFLVACPKSPTATCGFDPCRLTITLEPNAFKLEKGKTGALAVKVTTDNGYAGPLEVRLGDLPAGTTGTITPSKATLGSDNNAFAGVLSVSTSNATVVAPEPQDIKVYALGNGISSSGAFKLTVTPSSLPPPKAPVGFAIIAISAKDISLFWNLSEGANAYTLERRVGSEAYAPLVALDSSATGYTDTGLSGNTVYTYRMTATNAGGTSPGVETSATTPPGSVVGRGPKP
jgi:hypothetical protein